MMDGRAAPLTILEIYFNAHGIKFQFFGIVILELIWFTLRGVIP